MQRVIILLSVILIIMLLTPPARADNARVAAIDDLWIDVSLGPPLVDWFNSVARPGDIARVESPEQLSLLDSVTAGQKLLVFKSVADAEQLLPRMAGEIDVIGYNLEHSPSTPPDEQEDPVGSVRRMRILAQEHGLTLALGPDRVFALENGVEMAPYVDIFVLQVQRTQTEPQTVRAFVGPLVQQLRRANPDLEISMQVRTEGDVNALIALLESLKEDLDGVSILTSPETIEVAEALVNELRPEPPATPTPAPSATPAQVAEVAETGANPTAASAQISLFHWLLLVAIALVAGGIGGGVVAAIAARSRQ